MQDIIKRRFRGVVRGQSIISEREGVYGARRSSEFRAKREGTHRGGNEKNGSPAHSPKESSARNVLFVFVTRHSKSPAREHRRLGC
jgi:hypothetical protein